MSRCVCCGRKLYVTEMVQKKVSSPEEYEDLCNICKIASFEEYDYLADHEFVCGGVREGLTDVVKTDY